MRRRSKAREAAFIAGFEQGYALGEAHARMHQQNAEQRDRMLAKGLEALHTPRPEPAPKRTTKGRKPTNGAEAPTTPARAGAEE